MRSLKTRFGLTAAVCALGALGFAGSASAYTLHSGSAGGSLVATGSTATGTSTSSRVVLQSGSTTVETCDGTLSASVTDNGGSTGNVTASVTSATFSNCSGISSTATPQNFPWTLKIKSGSSSPFGGEIDNVAVDLGGDVFMGNLVDGLSGGSVQWYNPTGPDCASGQAEIKLVNAHNLSDGGFFTNGAVTGNFCINQSWYVA